MGDVVADKKKPFRTFGIRAITGLILLSVCGIPVYFGGWVFAAFVALVAARMIWEWVRMSDRAPGVFAYGIPVLVALLSVYFAYLDRYYLVFFVLVLGSIFTIALAIVRQQRLLSGLGLVYTILPCIAAIWVRGIEPGIGATGFQKLVYVVCIVVAADSFAYLGGSLLKGPKFAPKISPNKTWSGFTSGFVCGGLVGGVLGLIFKIGFWYGAALAVPLVLASVFGDLFESAVKRTLDVKDSGNVLPGHGGVLDRVDSLMMALLLAAIALYFWPQIWPSPESL